MLILTRAVNESVVIETSDGQIEVVVSRFASDSRVRLGFIAPAEIPINRKEVWEEIQRNKENEKRKEDGENDGRLSCI